MATFIEIDLVLSKTSEAFDIMGNRTEWTLSGIQWQLSGVMDGRNLASTARTCASDEWNFSVMNKFFPRILILHQRRKDENIEKARKYNLPPLLCHILNNWIIKHSTTLPLRELDCFL